VNRRNFLRGAAATSAVAPIFGATDQGVGPATTRTPLLAEYERLQFGCSYHFSMNTFTGDDYEIGAVPATTYNPTHLDVKQWIDIAKMLGARYAVLTAKHMSGFALWPTDDYTYDVSHSSNKTDVVGEFVANCKASGLKYGYYYCILDPHNEGKFDWNSMVPDHYYSLIKRHITELHTKYPGAVYQLFDITWKITLEQRWELYRLVKKLNSNCVIVDNQGFDQSRRNQGRICEPKSWPTDVINGEDTLPPPEGHDPHVMFEGKQYYMPFETWLPTGPIYKPMPRMHSWFWRNDFTTQPAEVIASAYRACVKGKSNLLLNLSPDNTGRITDEAAATMRKVAQLIHA